MDYLTRCIVCWHCGEPATRALKNQQYKVIDYLCEKCSDQYLIDHPEVADERNER